MIAYADSLGLLPRDDPRLLRRARRAVARAVSAATARAGATLSAEDLLRLRKILSGVARGGERWGKRRLVAMLTGDLEGLPDPLTRLSTTGILAARAPRTVGDWIDAAQGGGLLAATDDVYRTLSLTRGGTRRHGRPRRRRSR